ncbi:geminin coiled-coil domain-containing protein 1 [Chanos chanos]|uniref:Geminin coiled-coil domain-containing protein 1 n=1 Tax=Chanos chanos TaxID=29144 RepID=A0A6J2VG81_CHACN|nr:geminin coiled-coil domain-containing protein 1 [Chanos chanos]
MLSCQDLSFVGGQRYDCPYSASASPDSSVDVSTTTLVPLWDACPLDNAACQHEPPRKETQHEYDHGTVHNPTWADQLSPQLQRNKQLQDTLMQREEELARLQEENNKLKEFLNSSYVKSLQEKSKKFLPIQNSGVRQRKRTLTREGHFPNLGHLLARADGKRTCRNLSLEFCSAEEIAATPPVDSWILETLGLRDVDTIDPDSSYSSPTGDPRPLFTSPVSKTNLGDSYSPTALDSTASYSPDVNSIRELTSIVGSSGSFSQSMDTCTSYSASASSSSEFSTLDPSVLYTVSSSGSSVSALHSSSPPEHLTPPRASSTPHRAQDFGSEQHYDTLSRVSSSPAGVSSELFSPPRTTRSRTDLAFSMSLSPQNSVKTHSFPQGQAFIRKDAQGGWNFTWVPKQCS